MGPRQALPIKQKFGFRRDDLRVANAPELRNLSPPSVKDCVPPVHRSRSLSPTHASNFGTFEHLGSPSLNHPRERRRA